MKTDIPRKAISFGLMLIISISLFGCGHRQTDGISSSVPSQSNNSSIASTEITTAAFEETVTPPQTPIEVTTATFEEKKDNLTIYAMVPSHWTDVRLWGWDDYQTNLSSSPWPGELSMTKRNDGWYSIQIPSWVNNVLINANEGTEQTHDLVLNSVADTWLDCTDPANVSMYYSKPNIQIPTYDNKIHYINERSVQYEESDDEYIVFFGFQNRGGSFLKADGVAHITIKDDSGNNLYQKDVSFTTGDFSNWTNRTWNTQKLLCGLRIQRSEIMSSCSKQGELLLSVETNSGSYFDECSLSIDNLPEKQVQINLPSTPTSLTDHSYYNRTQYLTVLELSYSAELSYDGTSTATINMMISLDGKATIQM